MSIPTSIEDKTLDNVISIFLKKEFKWGNYEDQECEDSEIINSDPQRFILGKIPKIGTKFTKALE